MKKQVKMVIWRNNNTKHELVLKTADIKSVCRTTLKDLEWDDDAQDKLHKFLKDAAKSMILQFEDVYSILILDDYAEESFEITREDAEREERRDDELQAELEACYEREAETQYVEQLEERAQRELELEAEERAEERAEKKTTKLYALSEEEYAEFLEWKREKEENQLWLDF